jgi:hypothetical protein
MGLFCSRTDEAVNRIYRETFPSSTEP